MYNNNINMSSNIINSKKEILEKIKNSKTIKETKLKEYIKFAENTYKYSIIKALIEKKYIDKQQIKMILKNQIKTSIKNPYKENKWIFKLIDYIDNISDIKDEDNYTLLMYVTSIATIENTKISKKLIEKLINKNAKINNKNIFGETAIIFAVYSENAEIVEYLVNKGGNPRIKDKFENTAYDHYIKIKNKKNIIEKVNKFYHYDRKDKKMNMYLKLKTNNKIHKNYLTNNKSINDQRVGRCCVDNK